MTDQVQGTQGTGEVTPVEDGQQVETTGAQSEQPAYVTRAEVQALIDEVKNRDKQRVNQIQARMGEVEKLLKTAGVNPSPEQAEQIKKQIEKQVDEVQTAPQDAVPAPPEQFNELLDNLFTSAGQKVSPNDPEWKDFQKAWDENFNNPDGLPIISVAAVTAARAKMDRLKLLQDTAANRGGTPPTNTTGVSQSSQSALQMLSSAYNSKK